MRDIIEAFLLLGVCVVSALIVMFLTGAWHG